MRTGEIVTLELRQGRSRLKLSKHEPGPILAALHPGSSFFYSIEMDGKMMRMTPDPIEARASWRSLHRWMKSGKTATASVL